MSESREDGKESRSSGRRTRSANLKSEDNSQCNEGSGDEIDDSMSTVTTGSIADDSSHCDTPTNGSSRRRKAGRHKQPSGGQCRFRYKCTNWLKEDHGQPIFGAQFNYQCRNGDPLILATVGSNRIMIYECGVMGSQAASTGELKLLQAYIDADSDENFYTCVWTSDTVSGLPLLAAAGSRGVIRVINPTTATCIKYYTGHGQSVNELKMHPKDFSILMSVSKDHSIRLWNLKTDVCIAIFGGVDGHRDEVLSGDIDITGKYIVSCGMDHSVKIWAIHKPCIVNAISQSFIPTEKSFPTVMQHYPDFSTRDIHSNYVDCVRWFGQFVMSKSCENRIVLWKPGGHTMDLTTIGAKPLPSDATSISVLYQFEFQNCDIWFVRFSMDHHQKVMALGNQIGRVYVWDIDVNDPAQAKYIILTHNKCTTPVRQTAFSKDGSVLVCVCDDATLWRWDRV